MAAPGLSEKTARIRKPGCAGLIFHVLARTGASSVRTAAMKKALTFVRASVLVAGIGLEPMTFGL